jgi:predicted enzyme related to lactoylglutathione lyase
MTSIQTVLYPVTDVDAAKAVFTVLTGAEPVVDQPHYVHYQVGEQSVGLVPGGAAQGMTGPVPYWHVDDVAKSIEALTAAGATVRQPVTDVGGGTLVATLTAPDGTPVALRQPAAWG